jgi:DNA invertase Pin-like site-specific DNA recombinase
LKKAATVAYFRTSSATNVGPDKASMRRQREAVLAYAKAHRLEVIQEFYDAAVSGADPIDARTAFTDIMAFCGNGGPKVVLVENAGRSARDLIVQLTGHGMMKKAGIELIPVAAPDFFTDPTPTAEMVRQILGAVSQFEKANLVAKLKHARDRKRAETGRCEGRKPVPPSSRRGARGRRPSCYLSRFLLQASYCILINATEVKP